MKSKKIYLASSWRNEFQPDVLHELRKAGHEVYDFRNPGPDDKGFGWSAIDPNWKSWTPEQFKEALRNPIARKGHKYDHDAMCWADTGVLLLPSGSSAHLEAGWMAGKGKPVCVYAPQLREPELMYLSLALNFDDLNSAGMFCTTMDEVLTFLQDII